MSLHRDINCLRCRLIINNVSLAEALDILYNSETYAKLQEPRTGLYFQSPVYVFDFLQRELEQGKIA